MSFIIPIRAQWKKQPAVLYRRLADSGSITDGLKLFTFGDHRFNCATKLPGVYEYVNGTTSLTVNARGEVGSYNTGAAHMKHTLNACGNGDLTAMMVGSPPATLRRYAFYQTGSAGQVWFGGGMDEYEGTVSGQLCLALLQTSVNRSAIKVAGAVDGGLHVYVVRKKAGAHAAWRDYTRLTVTTVSTLAGAPTAAADTIQLYGKTTDSSCAFGDHLTAVGIWQRGLGDAEVESLIMNVWKALAP